MRDDNYDPIDTLRWMDAGVMGEVRADETAGANDRMQSTTKAQRRRTGSATSCSAKRRRTSPAGESRWRRLPSARSPPEGATPARRPQSTTGCRQAATCRLPADLNNPLNDTTALMGYWINEPVRPGALRE